MRKYWTINAINILIFILLLAFLPSEVLGAGAYYSDVPHYNQSWFTGSGDCLPNSATQVLGWHDAHNWPRMVPGGTSNSDNSFNTNPTGVTTTMNTVKNALDWWNNQGTMFYAALFDVVGNKVKNAAKILDTGASGWWADDDDWTSWTDMQNQINNYGPMMFITFDSIAYYYGSLTDGNTSNSGSTNNHAMCMYGYSENVYKVNATARWIILDTGWSNTSPAWINYDAPSTGDVYTVEIRATGTPTAPPSRPTSITYPTSDSDGSYTVSWPSSSGATSYQLEMSSNGGSTWSQIYSGSSISRPQNVSGGSYRYRVRAFDGSVYSSWRTGTHNCAVVTLSSITITGSISVNESSGAQYTCTANYSDGSSSNVTNSASWSENSSYSSINSSGYLTTYSVSSDQSCTISASYGGKSDTHSVTIKNVAASLSYITISGSTQVNENSGAQYTCTAYYSDGSSSNVTSSASWSENSNYTSIGSSGYLSTSSVSSDQSCTITASYEGKSDIHDVTIKNTAPSTGYVSVSQGVTVAPTPVVLNQDFTVSFTLKEVNGAPITFENIAVAILRSDNSHLFDLAIYNNVTISANGTWSRAPTGQIYDTSPPGTYKAIIRGKVSGGNWFDFGVTVSGINPRSFTVENPVTLSYVTISGSTQVNENSGAQYTCTAYYSDGSTSNVTSSASWSENSSYASISSSGYLTTFSVSSDQSCTITASYEGKSDTNNVTIKNIPPSGYTISGVVKYSSTLLANVKVELRFGTNAEVIEQTVFSNSVGEYQLNSVTDGDYQLRAYGPTSEYITWQGWSVSVSGADLVRDFALAKNIILLTPENGNTVTTLSPTLTWTPNNEATEYIVQVNVSSTWELVDHPGGIVGASYTLSHDLQDGETYTWQVDARDASGTYVGGTMMAFQFSVNIEDVNGDINSDGNVDLNDAILALQVLAGLSPDGIHLSADVNGDGRIGISEVIYIMQKVAGVRD